MSETVFIAQPNYNGTMHQGCAQAIYRTASRRFDTLIYANPMSLVSHNCNHCYATALNMNAEHRFKWFAILHSDVKPDDFWLDTLDEEAEANGADMIAAYIPIKDDRGIHSTAILNPENPWTPFTRITTAQAAALPKTVDIEQLANLLPELPPSLRVENVPRSVLQVNTGCCLIRMDRPWSKDVYFSQVDRIFCIDGAYQAKTQSEDWRVSRRVAELGGKVCVTRAVAVEHDGNSTYPSNKVWGNPIDIDCLGER